MSQIIQKAEQAIVDAKKQIKVEKLREAKEAIKDALKRNDDTALSSACILFYAHSRPPTSRKPKTSSPVS